MVENFSQAPIFASSNRSFYIVLEEEAVCMDCVAGQKEKEDLLWLLSEFVLALLSLSFSSPPPHSPFIFGEGKKWPGGARGKEESMEKRGRGAKGAAYEEEQVNEGSFVR